MENVELMDYEIRKATLEDRPAIEQLISESARGLSRDEYTPEQIEAALGNVFGVDTDLILDQTYYVAESSGQLIGCGGWSKRRTLFGGDRYGNRDSSELDPHTESARIRAFFVHPSFARRGIGRSILSACENDAINSGFHSLELIATLPGVKFYQALGYQGTGRVEHEAAGNVKLEFVPMKKVLT